VEFVVARLGLLALPTVITILVPLACGGQTLTTSQDGGMDATHMDVAVEHLEGAREVSVADREASPEEDAFGPPPADAARFGSCVPYPCTSSEICVFYSPNEQRGECDGLPAACEPIPTCKCIEQAAAPWCNVADCTVDEGGTEVVLTCTTPQPP
jgi:hypothetical protein